MTGCVTREIVRPLPEEIQMVCTIDWDTPWTTQGNGEFEVATCDTRDGREFEFILGRQGGV